MGSALVGMVMHYTRLMVSHDINYQIVMTSPNLYFAIHDLHDYDYQQNL